VRKNTTIAVVCFVLILLSPALFRKYTVPLLSNGKAVAVATRPFVFPWNDNEFSVYAGKSKVFGLWADIWDFPVFVYPFADGKRYLCIDDDDTSVPVFVVDLNGSATNNPPNSQSWPTDDHARQYLAGRMTNVVMEIATGCRIRLPTRPELEESSSNITSLSPQQLRTTSFPSADLGLIRSYWTKEDLLAAIATNRHGVDP
jgi:hypothetical protein